VGARDARVIAQNYIDQGFRPVPLEPGLKKILIPDWNDPSRVFTKDDFHTDSNVGVALGVPGTAPNGKSLVDGDLDAKEWRLIADIFRPGTGAVWGRDGKPDSHAAFIVDHAGVSATFNSIDNDMLGEFRSHTADGKVTQSVVPGSIWTDENDGHSEAVKWAFGCSLAAAAELPDSGPVLSFVRNGCIAIQIARFFPNKGARHEGRLPLAGFLLSLPITEDEVRKIGIGVMRLVNGDESDWDTVLNATAKKKQDGKRIESRNKLATLLGPKGAEITDLIRGWFAAAAPEEDDEEAPRDSAALFLAEKYSVMEGDKSVSTLYFQQGTFYQYQGVAYREYEMSLARKDVYLHFESATKKQVDEMIDALKAFAALSKSAQSPCWLNGGGQLDPKDILVCRNGLLHVPTRTLLPATPSFYSFNQIGLDYNSNAAAPTRFLKFLDSLFPKGDPEAIQAIQEAFGYALTPDRRLQKILMFIGPRRGGKGTLAKILQRLLGPVNVCSPTLSTMGDTFGRQSLIGKQLAIIGDLRIGPNSDIARITETLLGISGQDEQTVHRKHKEDWNGILNVLFLILSNELPNFRDSSGALASRFVIVQLTESFYAREDHHLLDNILATDLPGILNWALEGRERLFARGHFVQPKTSQEALDELEALASPIKTFIQDDCEVGNAASISKPLLFANWKLWCSRNNHIHVGTAQTFGKNLRSALPSLTTTQSGGDIRSWVGIKMKDAPATSVEDQGDIPF
jgi:putative DNA primase/helicase